jgi:hypothetical protein
MGKHFLDRWTGLPSAVGCGGTGGYSTEGRCACNKNHKYIWVTEPYAFLKNLNNK